MPEKVIEGFSKRLDRSYALSVGLADEGGISITETYDYPARGEMEGREYSYHLEIPAAYAHPFLARLAREGHRDLPRVHTDKQRQRWLVALLKQLVKQGVLASVETATAKQNLETLISWLEQEKIPYEKRTWVF